MLFEFKLYKMNEQSNLFNLIRKYDKTNEFIVVGEKTQGEKEYFEVHQLTDNGLKLIGGLRLDESSYTVEKNDMERIGDGIGFDYTEIDIPKEYLDMDLIETIQRLNN